MDLAKFTDTHFYALWELRKAYRTEIGEEVPGKPERERLAAALRTGRII